MQLGFVTRVAPMVDQQPFGEVHQQGGVPHVGQVVQAEVYGLANDARVLRDGGANQVRRQHQHGICIELCRQTLVGQLNPVALHAGELNLQCVAVLLCTHLYRLTRRLGLGDHRLGGEVKRDTQHVGVFDVEKAFLVQVVGLAAQGAANHLFAQ